MKKIKVGVNGFHSPGSVHVGGSVADYVSRAIAFNEGLELVAVNDPFYDEEYDKVAPPSYITIPGLNNNKIRMYRKKKLEDVPWAAHGDLVVVECSGIFLNKGNAAVHLKAGAKKVIIVGSSHNAPMFVVGVNDREYKSDLAIVCSGNITINAIAPLAKVINDRFGIVEGFVSTMEAIDPKLAILFREVVDSTPALDVAKVIPSLDGKLDGSSFIYSPNDKKKDFSFVDLTITLEKPATYEDIKKAIKDESEGKLKDILRYTDDYVESTDFATDNSSSIFDAHAGVALNDKFVKVVSRYGNPTGYFCRVVDLIFLLGSDMYVDI